jgi:heptosyltransferase-2
MTASRLLPPGKILVVGPAWVGDMVMAQSLFAVLRRRYPDAAIDVLAPRWTLPLLDFMPEVGRPILLPLGHGELGLRERRRLGRGLRAEGYDLALVLPGSVKAALVPYWARIPERRGYGGTLRRRFLTEVRPKPKLAQVESFVALADDAGEVPRPRLSVTTEATERALDAFGIERPTAPLLALAPGAEYGPAKRWPTRHFAALAREVLARGWEVWLFGSLADREVALQIPCTRNLAGRTRLDHAVALLALADVLVSNDSGLMHVGDALDRREIALFGPSDPGRTGPRNPAARVLSLDLDCSPCNKRVCPLGHHRCLEELMPERVQALLPVL